MMCTSACTATSSLQGQAWPEEFSCFDPAEERASDVRGYTVLIVRADLHLHVPQCRSEARSLNRQKRVPRRGGHGVQQKAVVELLKILQVGNKSRSWLWKWVAREIPFTINVFFDPGAPLHNRIAQTFSRIEHPSVILRSGVEGPYMLLKIRKLIVRPSDWMQADIVTLNEWTWVWAQSNVGY